MTAPAARLSAAVSARKEKRARFIEDASGAARLNELQGVRIDTAVHKLVVGRGRAAGTNATGLLLNGDGGLQILPREPVVIDGPELHGVEVLERGLRDRRRAAC